MNAAPQSYKVIDGECRDLGFVCFYSGVKGWLFVSHVQGHGNTRTPRATALEAMPAWVRRKGAMLL